jgi:selenocysteine lyase/cysteine desulfurase
MKKISVASMTGTADAGLVLSSSFPSAVGYLDSATYGLPPLAALEELASVTAAWAAGTYEPVSADDAVARARGSFARLHRVRAADVAIGHQVSPFVGLVGGSLRRGATVLVAEGDFTSLLFPFLAAGCTVESVPLERLAHAIDSRTELVAVSAVQSADGRLADLGGVASAAEHHGAITVIDATQASGWLPLDGGRFDVLVSGGYKWLCHPRGTAFMTVRPELRDRLIPIAAGWYAGDRPWDTCYGTPLRLAADARRFDVSPAWFSWHAAAAALALLEDIGIERVHEHDVALANRLRAGLDVCNGDSPIVSLAAHDAAVVRLARAGIKASVRAGRVRLSCHLYNEESDVDRALEALAGSRAPPPVPRGWADKRVSTE